MTKKRESYFKVGDIVRMSKKDLKGNDIGTITEVERIFQEIDGRGEFVKNGLRVGESIFNEITVPPTFDGEIAYIMGRPHKFYEYSYMVQAKDGHRTGYLSRHLRKARIISNLI